MSLLYNYTTVKKMTLVILAYVSIIFLPLFPSVDGIFSCDNETIINIRINGSSVAGSSPISCTPNDTAVSYICPSLAMALELEEFQDSSCNITIMIPSNTVHHIVKSVIVLSSVSLMGEDPTLPSRINCSHSGNFTNPALNYTVYFNCSAFVELANIEMSNCPFPINLTTIQSLKIVNTTMMYFYEAALEIFNCERVYIAHCNFISNRGNGISPIPFRGNTGAVSIGIFNLDVGNETEIIIEVHNTTFYNNSALAPKKQFRSTSQAFLKGILPGRAGGLGVFIHEDYSNVSITVSNCSFDSNYARAYGGGLYFVYSGNKTIQSNSDYHPRIIGRVTMSTFINNKGGLGGGGFIASVQSRGPNGFPHLLTFENCVFEDNIGNGGGAFYYYVIYFGGHGNQLIVKNTMFSGNRGNSSTDEFGGALAASIYQEYNSMGKISVHVIEDCYFTGNKGRNAIVSLGYIPFKFIGTNVFENNGGDSLRVIGSYVTFGGNMLFVNNTCTQLNCGALSLLSFAQIRLVKNLLVDFINNTGRFGASIYVDPFDLSVEFQKLPYNPHCFLLPEKNQKRPPEEWTNDDNVTMRFVSNKAYFGSVMYISNLAQCSWVSGGVFNTSHFRGWGIFNYTDGNNNNTGFVDNMDPLHSIVTDAVSIEATNNKNLTIWPGEEVNLDVSTVDELQGATGSIIRLKFTSLYNNQSEQIDENDVKISPNTFVEVQDPFPTKFKVFIRNDTQEPYDGFHGNISLEYISSTIAQEIKVIEHNVSVTITQCPGGYNLAKINNSPDQLRCSCNSKTQKEIIQCEGEDIVVQTGQWTTRVFNADPSLLFLPCPPGYCQCYNYSSIGYKCAHKYSNNDPNSQCSKGRTGTLCGNCNATMTAILNQCTSEHKHTLTWPWFLGLGLLDAIIITIIVILDKPLPQWSYPMLFYVQMTPILVLYFSEEFWDTGKYLYFLASLIGLYVPYDFCLHGSIHGIVPHALKFIPIITAIIVCPIIVLINIALVKRRLNQIRLKLHGVWAIIVLLYPSVIMNAVRSLHCRHISDPDSYSNESGSYRWFSDGSIQCFAGYHLILTFIGCLMLLLNFVFMFSLIALKFKTHECSQRWVVKFVQSVAHPYTRNNHLWGVADLFFKFGLIILIEIFPGKKVQCVMFLSLIVCISSFCNPYKKMFFNYFQVSIYSVILILLMLDTSNILDIAFPPKPSDIDSNDDRNTIILLVLYYLPLVMSLFVICIVAISVCFIKLYLPFRERRARVRDRHSGLLYADEFSCQHLNPHQINTVDVTEISVTT